MSKNTPPEGLTSNAAVARARIERQPETGLDFVKPKLALNHKLKSFDEFSPLKAIIIGNPTGANHPEIDDSFENFFQPPQDSALRNSAIGPVPKLVIDEIEEDIAGFTAILQKLGVEVIRPASWDSSVKIKTPLWETSQLYSLMPRDSVIVVGDVAIETPSPMRARLFESYAFRDILDTYVRMGAHLVAAPRPLLGDETFDKNLPNLITNEEVLFDAANCIRLGKDIFMDINRTANLRGLKWLERTVQGLVDPSIRVHPMSIGYDHVDVTLVPLRPGTILVDPAKVNDINIPSQFRNWDRVIVDEVMPTRDYGLPYPLASNDGIGRNVLLVDQQTVIVDDIQVPLIRALEKRGFTVVPLQYRHGRTLGGSWHCITLDTHRAGELESYF